MDNTLEARTATLQKCTNPEEMEEDADPTRKRTFSINGEGNSSEDSWTTVLRGNKAVRKENVVQEIGENVQICVTSKNDLPKQFALAKLLQDHVIEDISKIKYVSTSKLLITFDKMSSADKFLHTKAFSDMEWNRHKTAEVGVSYGVIKNVEMDLSEEDILRQVSSPIEIMSSKRLNRRNMEETDGGGAALWVPSESIRLGFKGTSVPPYVFIHKIRIKVEQYIFPVTQCGRCWKFGHMTRFCPSKKIICPKCTKKHESCETESFKCVNCHGPHMAMNKSCPNFKKERKIREIMSEFNVTYSKGKEMYVPPSPVAERLERPLFASDDECVEVDMTPIPLSTIKTPVMVANSVAGCSYASIAKSKKVNKEKPSQVVIKTHKQKENTEEYEVQEQEQDQGLGDNRERKKKQKKRKQHMASAFSWNEEHSGCSEEEPSTPPMETDQTYESNNDFTLTSLLSKLKDIIFSRRSIDKKIEMSIKMCIEWVISKTVSYVTAGTFFSSDPHYG